MESDLEARGWCDLARASCGKVLATCPDRFARVAKTHNERDYMVAAPLPLAVLWLHLGEHCGRTVASHEKPKGA